MPDHRLAWGVLGCAGIARSAFIPAVQHTKRGFVAAIASRNQAKAESWAREFGIPKAYGSYEALLTDEAVKAVYIPLPNTLHTEWVTQAAAHGKIVFCEKPLAEDAPAAARALAACQSAGVPFFEAFVYRFHPQTDRLAALLADGAIGQVRYTHSRFHYFLPEAARPTNIRGRQDVAGGALMDVGCYCINWSRFLFGEEPQAVAARLAVDPALGVDLTATAQLAFSGDRTATFSASMGMAGGQWAAIYGTQGDVYLTQPFHPRGAGARIVLRRGGKEEVIEAADDRPPFVPQIEHIHACALDGAAPRLTAADGVANMRVIDACRRAAASAWVQVD